MSTSRVERTCMVALTQRETRLVADALAMLALATRGRRKYEADRKRALDVRARFLAAWVWKEGGRG